MEEVRILSILEREDVTEKKYLNTILNEVETHEAIQRKPSVPDRRKRVMRSRYRSMPNIMGRIRRKSC